MPDTLKIMQAVVIALGCPPERNGKTLLLKILHTIVTEHGGIKLVPSMKLPLGWLAVMVPGGVMLGAESKKYSTVLASWYTADQRGKTLSPVKQWHKCCGNNQPFSDKACSMRKNAYLVL